MLPKLTTEQQNNYCRFLYQTLQIVGQFCPEVVKAQDKVALKTNSLPLITCTKGKIETPYLKIIEDIFQQPGGLLDEDEFITTSQITDLFNALKQQGATFSFDHLGFSYHTQSVTKNVQHLCTISQTNHLFTYQMTVPDDTVWIFVGDNTKWREPMLEFIPLEGEIIDKEIDYWLPGLHLNINTHLAYDDICSCINSIFKGTRDIHPNYYGKFITQARVWVGVVSGINLHFDFSTLAQNRRYTRKVMLEKLS
jgi:hypothetical protein